MYGILLSCLDWCSLLLLGIVRQATKTNIPNCWSFICCFSRTLSLLWKYGQLKSFLQVLLWQMFCRTVSTGSTSFFLREVSHYSDRLHDFSVTIPRSYKDVYVSSFFPARLWNSLSIECSPLTIILVVLSLELTDLF